MPPRVRDTRPVSMHDVWTNLWFRLGASTLQLHTRIFLLPQQHPTTAPASTAPRGLTVAHLDQGSSISDLESGTHHDLELETCHGCIIGNLCDHLLFWVDPPLSVALHKS